MITEKTCSISARTEDFVLSFLYLILSFSVFLFPLCGIVLDDRAYLEPADYESKAIYKCTYCERGINFER